MSTSTDIVAARQLRLVIRIEDGLRADDDDLGLMNNPAGRGASARQLEDFAALFVREKSAHG